MSQFALQIALVAGGGAVGSVLRYLSTLAGTRLFGPGFPVGTLFVNLVGCFAIGVLAHILLRFASGQMEARALLVTGLIGGFTTFSAFGLDAMALYERGEGLTALFYVLASVVGGLAAVGLGLFLARQFG